MTMTGANLIGATNVLFGSVATTNFSVVSDSEITAVSPTQAGDARNVYVFTPTGASRAVAADAFTYAAVATPFLG
jgi:hypothetical protein